MTNGPVWSDCVNQDQINWFQDQTVLDGTDASAEQCRANCGPHVCVDGYKPELRTGGLADSDIDALGALESIGEERHKQRHRWRKHRSDHSLNCVIRLFGVWFSCQTASPIVKSTDTDTKTNNILVAKP